MICCVEENRELLADITGLLKSIHHSLIDIKYVVAQDSIMNKEDEIVDILNRKYLTRNGEKVKIIKNDVGNTVYKATYRLDNNSLSTIVLCVVDNFSIENSMIKIGMNSYNVSDKDLVRQNIDNNIYLVSNAYNLLINIVD